VEIPLDRDFGVVTSTIAPEVALSFSMRLSLMREALVVIEGRLARGEVGEGLPALKAMIEDTIVALPSRIGTVHDPVAILRALHGVPELHVAPEFVSAILGIRDEQVGGEITRYNLKELRSEYAQGGFMYQPSELIDIWPIYHYLAFRAGVIFYDLGSGYGHALFYGAALRPDLSFKGIELMTARVVESRSAAARLGLDNLTFAAGDVAKGGFGDADILFLFNPFPPDTEVDVRQQLAELAGAKPIVVLDYQGIVTRDLPELRSIPFAQVTPYRLKASRGYYEASCELVGFPEAGRRNGKAG
jgi:hypothetical protein